MEAPSPPPSKGSYTSTLPSLPKHLSWDSDYFFPMLQFFFQKSCVPWHQRVRQATLVPKCLCTSYRFGSSTFSLDPLSIGAIVNHWHRSKAMGADGALKAAIAGNAGGCGTEDPDEWVVHPNSAFRFHSSSGRVSSFSLFFLVQTVQTSLACHFIGRAHLWATS